MGSMKILSNVFLGLAVISILPLLCLAIPGLILFNLSEDVKKIGLKNKKWWDKLGEHQE